MAQKLRKTIFITEIEVSTNSIEVALVSNVSTVFILQVWKCWLNERRVGMMKSKIIGTSNSLGIREFLMDHGTCMTMFPTIQSLCLS